MYLSMQRVRFSSPDAYDNFGPFSPTCAIIS